MSDTTGAVAVAPAQSEAGAPSVPAAAEQSCGPTAASPAPPGCQFAGCQFPSPAGQISAATAAATTNVAVGSGSAARPNGGGSSPVKGLVLGAQDSAATGGSMNGSGVEAAAAVLFTTPGGVNAFMSAGGNIGAAAAGGVGSGFAFASPTIAHTAMQQGSCGAPPTSALRAALLQQHMASAAHGGAASIAASPASAGSLLRYQARQQQLEALRAAMRSGLDGVLVPAAAAAAGSQSAPQGSGSATPTASAVAAGRAPGVCA